jgi:hypothetical protein
MHQSLTVVLERNARLTGTFATEPYEVAWAREARWFIRVIEMAGTGTRLEATAQISPDGLHWCDLDDRATRIEGAGLVSWSSREFGGWLRLKGRVEGDGDAIARVMVYLALKA